MVSAGIGTDTLCIIVIIVRGNLTLSLQKRNCRRRSKVTGFKNSEQNDQLTKPKLRRGFILPDLDITVPGSTIRLKRLEFRLKWV